MQVIDGTRLADRAAQVEIAVRNLKRGRLVVAPSESSYVVLADAFNTRGLSTLRAYKEDEHLQPGLLVGSAQTVDGIAIAIPATARELMAACWPGELSLVLRQQPSLAWKMVGETVVVRMPIHPFLLGIVKELGPTAVSVANRRGAPAPRTVELLSGEDEIDIVLDTGEIAVGPPSTVVDATSADPVLLRAGPVSATRIQEVCPTADVSLD